MKVKLSLLTPNALSPEALSRDIMVTVDATATVGEVANYLRAADPVGVHASGSDLTLRVSVPGQLTSRLLNPLLTIHESILRSGCTVELVSAVARRADDQLYGAPVALVTIIQGPDAGQSFTLAAGANYVGRDVSARVPLTDDECSLRHASITVGESAGESITISDLNSANGVDVDGSLISRAILSRTSQVTVGRTVFSVGPLAATTAFGNDLVTARVGVHGQLLSGPRDPSQFSRSPRVEPSYRGTTTPVPELPGIVEKTRFPVLAVIAPILMGVVLFAITKQALSLIFIALSPLIMFGTWIDNRTQNRRTFRDGVARFATSLAHLRRSLLDEREREMAARTAESPSMTQISEAVENRLGLLWTRKPEHSTFLEVRFGTGTLPSRNVVAPPSTNSSSPDDWASAQKLIDDFSTVDVVPVVENLERAGCIGIAGSNLLAADAARSLVAQLVGLHSPSELVLTAFGAAEANDGWAWLKWLPHVDSPHSPFTSGALASTFSEAAALLSELEELIARRATAGAGRGAQVRSRLDEATTLDAGHGLAVERLPAVPAIIVLVTAEAPADRARLVALASEGPDVGVHIIWLAASRELLPVVCRTFLDIDADGHSGRVGFVRFGHLVELQSFERLDSISALRFARHLAPVEDTGAQVLDESDLPRTVRFLDLFDGPLADEPEAVVQRWLKNDSLTASWLAGVARESGGIRALVGQGPAEPFYLDLRQNGPHALVGGTTGSGKSEFLQTWIMAMATEYSPDRVTFLLVDYKGGAAFAECVGLPHTVGLVTDLNTHLVRRALVSLRAELRHREQLLNAKGAKDLESLERRSDPDAPPALVIVIDEFAALAAEVPEFVDGVIDVAQRGRSLGLHLVMATQRPAGVIKDSLRANTNLRVALRMADVADSHDVVGVPTAAQFDPSNPGRAAAKLGPGRVFDFQAAYLGGHETAGHQSADIEVADLAFGHGAAWLPPRVESVKPVGPRRDIERLAATISRAATVRSLAVPRKPWLDPLPDVVDLMAIVPAHSELQLILGLEDDPGQQRQQPFSVNLDVEGNVAIFGTGASGKSALLRTVALAASRTASSQPVTIYALDCAGGGLAGLAGLPTVGSVIAAEDTERITRLIKDLSATLTDRTARFSAANAATLTEYWANVTKGKGPVVAARLRADAPRIIVLIDGMAAFRSDWEYRNSGTLFDELGKLMSSGRQVGIHCVIAADRLSAFPSAMLATLQRRIVLRLANVSEYALLSVPDDALTGVPAGRALSGSTALGGFHEVQFAVIGGSVELTAQAEATSELAAALRAGGVAETPEIERLAELIGAESLPLEVAGNPTFGVSDESLEPVGVPVDGLFVVTGPFGSGRTSAMTTIVQGVAATRPHLARYLIVARRSDLLSTVSWTAAATDADSASELALSLAEALEAPSATRDTALVIVIENVGDFEGLAAESAVARLIKAARRADVAVFVESDTVTAASAWQIFAELKTARAGIALQPEESDGASLFRVQFPRGTRADFAVGRGILVSAGQTVRMQVAFPARARLPRPRSSRTKDRIHIA